MTDKLLACPFCGGEAHFDTIGNSDYYTVTCPDRCVRLGKWSKDKAEVAAAWNRRTPDVVRCEECENWGDEYYCPFIGKTTLYNFFCGYGVRKDCSV